jgi:ATP-binding cassette subfamily B protein
MNKGPGILSVLKPYWRLIVTLLVFTLLGNAINLLLPWIIAHSIDDFTAGRFVLNPVLIKFSIAVVFIFIFTWLQTIIQTFASERVARDLRTRLSDKISRQDNSFIERVNASSY